MGDFLGSHAIFSSCAFSYYLQYIVIVEFNEILNNRKLSLICVVVSFILIVQFLILLHSTFILNYYTIHLMYIFNLNILLF